MKAARLLLVVAVLSGVSLTGAWALRIHDRQQNDRSVCERVENTNTALRIVLDIRLRDPSTPADVKGVFRIVLVRYLHPVDCNHL